MVYRVADLRYMVVVNAANADKDWAWLSAVNEQAVCIDDQRPWVRSCYRAQLQNVHEAEDDTVGLADLALQGPCSLDILLKLVEADSGVREKLVDLARAGVMEARVPCARAPGGVFDLVIARTGYTGEPMAFEILVPRHAAVALWEQLSEIGRPMGLQPVGLGARDSLRIEAGLPLYGHELDGPLDLRPDDAGFGSFVRLHKPFFVGRQAYIEHARQRKMVVVRFRIGRKGVRVPKPEDRVVDNHGRVIGQVTSCAMGSEGYLVGQAYIDKRHAHVGVGINIFPHPTREDWEKPYDELALGDRLVLHSEATIVSRFMKRKRQG